MRYPAALVSSLKSWQGMPQRAPPGSSSPAGGQVTEKKHQIWREEVAERPHGTKSTPRKGSCLGRHGAAGTCREGRERNYDCTPKPQGAYGLACAPASSPPPQGRLLSPVQELCHCGLWQVCFSLVFFLLSTEAEPTTERLGPHRSLRRWM